MSDLTTMTDEELVDLRIAVATEQERRDRAVSAPALIADTARAAIEGGVDPQALRDALETGLAPEPTEPTEPADETGA